MEALRRDLATSLRTKYVRVGRLLPLQAAQRPQFVALNRVNARRPSFAASNVQAPGIQLDLMPLQIADLGSSQTVPDHLTKDVLPLAPRRR